MSTTPDSPQRPHIFRMLPVIAALVGVALLFAACTNRAPKAHSVRIDTGFSVTASASPYGTILTLSSGYAVYKLSTDKKNTSMCYTVCAIIWPPVLLPSTQASPKGISGLGVTMRKGGKSQITYKGYPLYTFSGDHRTGTINGNETDSYGRWSVINPTTPAAYPIKTASRKHHVASTSTDPSTTEPSATDRRTTDPTTSRTSQGSSDNPTTSGAHHTTTNPTTTNPTTTNPTTTTKSPPHSTTTTTKPPPPPTTTTTAPTGGGVSY